MGWVGAALTVAGGGDYGDETVETMRGHVWEGNHEVGDNILQQYRWALMGCPVAASVS